MHGTLELILYKTLVNQGAVNNRWRDTPVHTLKRKDVNASTTISIDPCTSAKRLMSLTPYLFASIDEAKMNAVKSGVEIRDGWDGIMVENTLAGYAHLHACSYLRFAEAFVGACL